MGETGIRTEGEAEEGNAAFKCEIKEDYFQLRTPANTHSNNEHARTLRYFLEFVTSTSLARITGVYAD